MVISDFWEYWKIKYEKICSTKKEFFFLKIYEKFKINKNLKEILKLSNTFSKSDLFKKNI